MNRAKNGDTVKVRYTAKSRDGELFGTNLGRPPLEVKIGSGELLPRLEGAIVGMEPGETRRKEQNDIVSICSRDDSTVGRH